MSKLGKFVQKRYLYPYVKSTESDSKFKRGVWRTLNDSAHAVSSGSAAYFISGLFDIAKRDQLFAGGLAMLVGFGASEFLLFAYRASRGLAPKGYRRYIADTYLIESNYFPEIEESKK